MDDDRILASMRQMAWERIKGEMEGIGCAMWGEYDRFKKWDRLKDKFIKIVDDNGYIE